MNSLIIKSAVVSAVIVASGLAAFNVHQTNVRNQKIVAEVTQSTNQAISNYEEHSRRAELGLVSQAEAGMRCDAGNDLACKMVVKYTLVRGFGDAPHPLTDAPSPMIETRARCAANGSDSDSCIELSLLQEVLDEHNQRIMDSYR
jgi:hypothetical protein